MASSIAGSTASQHNPFSTPAARSRRPSFEERKNGHIVESRPLVRRKIKDSRLVGDYEKPWLQNKDPRAKLPNIIFGVGMFIAVGVGAFLIYRAYAAVPRVDFCLAWEDDFKTLDTASWNHEVQIDGFGTGSFDWTTSDPRNSFVDDKGLHIVPTLTTDDTDLTMDQILDGHTLNLTKDGTCTAKIPKYFNTTCWFTSNFSSGATLPPVRSARLSTAGKHSIKYGRVEVVAKISSGDWLWPAIWMMPENGGAYGDWPMSGEMDLAEFRGNAAKEYKEGGIDTAAATLHWGPSLYVDRYVQTTAARVLQRSDFGKEFNTFGLEWTPDYIFMYINSRLNQVMNLKFPKNTNMWTRGFFAKEWSIYGKKYIDTWSATGRANTPFDQPFYLILNVAVGARNLYFTDGHAGKPWTDTSTSSVRDFAEANATWYPTWDKEGMTVKSVKMWNLGKC